MNKKDILVLTSVIFILLIVNLFSYEKLDEKTIIIFGVLGIIISIIISIVNIHFNITEKLNKKQARILFIIYGGYFFLIYCLLEEALNSLNGEIGNKINGFFNSESYLCILGLILSATLGYYTDWIVSFIKRMEK